MVHHLTLIAQNPLTHDVYELCYEHDGSLQLLPGQYLLCDCDSQNSKLKRSYSVSDFSDSGVEFVIKKIPYGGGGSKAICEQEIGHTMQAWGPLGRFVLQDTTSPKIFIGTGTGFAPLYCMIKKLFERDCSASVQFLFGVREARDIFYKAQLSRWSQERDFSYTIYCSRETDKNNEYEIGRVTDGIPINQDVEYYICGSPVMVTDVRKILSEKGVSEERIFFEQY